MIPNRKTILVADDSETFVMFVSLLLNRLGFNVIPAANGPVALKLAKSLLPDIVILGDEIAGMGCMDVLKEIKRHEQTSHVPVIIVSVHTSEEQESSFLSEGCAGFLTKPVNIHDLNSILEECIIYTGGKRRRFLRTPFNKKVSLRYRDMEQELFAVSLSEGGMYIRKLNPFPVGSSVEVTIPIDEIESLSIMGTVIYHKGLYGDMIKIAPGMGISFDELSSEDSTILRAYITELLARDLVEEQEEPIITFRRENGKSIFLNKYRPVSALPPQETSN